VCSYSKGCAPLRALTVLDSGTLKRMRHLTVVLSGGPCGGKSTALAHLRAFIAKRWGGRIDVYAVPEVPTILQNGGCKYPGTAPDAEKQLLEFESAILSLQMATEDSFSRVAASIDSRQSVLLLDRCAFDLAAYCSSHIWTRTIEGLGQSEAALARRYDHALFLSSAACGAEQWYTQQNNAARTESVAEAREVDQRTRDVYAQRFPPARMDFLENEADGMEGKLSRCEQAVERVISSRFPQLS